MLGILWLILKIVLILLGIILGIALFVVLVLLFAPFKYNAFARKEEVIDINGNAGWLFGLIRAEYISNGEDSDFVLKYPFSSKKNKKEAEQAVFVQQTEEKIKQGNEQEEIKPAETAESTASEITEIKAEERVFDKYDSESVGTEKISPIEKIKAKLCGVYNSVKGIVTSIKEYIDKGFEINEKYDCKAVISKTFKLIKKLFKNTGFKVFEINGIIGFEDPSVTGKLLGIKSAVDYIIPVSIDIDGDFEQKRLEGSVALSGRTNLFRLLFPIVVYILRKPIRPIVIDYLRGEK